VLAFIRMFVCAAVLVSAPCVSAPCAFAQNWPTRPVKLIVPTGPGSATDVMARLLADGASRGLGQAIIVENLPGASGIVAHQAAARATPDGYTFLFTNTSGMAINPISFKQLPYDPTRDFTAVALVCNLGPQMLSVNAALPVGALPEFIAYAKANPGKLSLAYDTTAGAAGFAAKLLNKRADLGLAEVPYRSAAQMGQDIASGVTQAMMSSIAAANPFIEAGKIRRIAISSGKRFPGLPDLPSITETVPGVVMDGFFAVVAPAGTPVAPIARFNREIAEFLGGADIRQRLLLFGLATDGAGTPESTGQYIRREQEQWRQFAKELDVQPQ
jgi:tripartite-type tricarboxylate transporter receptor subunit TctC